MMQVQVPLVMAILVQHWVGNIANDDVNASKKNSNMHTLLTQPETTPTGMFNVKSPPGGLTPAAGDGITDDTSAIQAIIDYAASSNTLKKVFFPPGEYLVSGNIIVKGSVQLHGSVDNMTVIKPLAAFVYRINNTGPISSVRLENLFFDGIYVKFNRLLSRDITVHKCVFFGSKGRQNRQLQFLHLSNGRIEKCIFLRDSDAFGVGMELFRTRNTIVTNNVFGLDLSRISWLSTQLEGEYWSKQEQKLGFLKSHYRLSNDQGFFKSALYAGYNEKMKIEKNVFNGSPHPPSKARDHVIYLKGFDGMYVTSNYARGWPSDPFGGIKARNGQNLEIARNYIDDTGILLYSHDPTFESRPLYPGLKNVVIYGNHIVMRTNLGSWGTGISYYEPHWRTHSAPDKNFRYAANEFEIPGVRDPNVTCIKVTNGDLTEHHIYEDNVYYALATPPRKVTLAAGSTFESGRISSSISNKYKGMKIYKLNIPVYS